MTENYPLELSSAEMRALVQAALDRIVARIESLPSQPVSDSRGGFEVAQSLAEPLPETGTPVAELLDLFFDRAIPPTMNTTSPGYLAYIPGGGLFHAAVADLIADSMNRYSSIYASAPALARIEMNVIDWFCQIAGYPPEARGTLTSGGSLANWTALVTARRERLPENFFGGVIYASHPAHHSGGKGAIPRRLPRGERPRGAHRRPLPPAAGRPGDPDRGGPPAGAHSVPDRGQRGHHQHRRHRSPAGDRGPRRTAQAVAARGRGLWRLLPADRRGEAGPARDRAGGLDRPRSPQGALPPLWHGRRAGARRPGAAPRPQPDGGLHAGDAGRSRPGGFQPVLAGALAAVPGAARLAAVQDARRGRLPRAVGGEARPRPAGGGPPAWDGGDRDARRAAALRPRLPSRPGGDVRRGSRRAQPALPRAHQRPPAGPPHPHAPAREIRHPHLRPLLPHPS